MNPHVLKVTGRTLPLSKATLARNPQLFSGGGALGPMAPAERKHNPASALVGQRPDQQSGAGGLAVRVDLVGCRARKLDDDNFTAGCKPLRDAIANTLGLDDGDTRIAWRYSQIVTDGPEGVLVIISTQF